MNTVELVFVIDKSGSMAGLESDTMGGYNAMLTKQKEVEGDCRITTVLFDHEYELLHDRLELSKVKEISSKDYQPRGSTALIDALGSTIQRFRTLEIEGPDPARKVLFVIMTDGLENASREYTAGQVRAMVKRQIEEAGWEFIFLGANIDAAETASQYGIKESMAQDFHADSEGMELNFRVMSETVTNYRASSSISENWKEDIDRNFRTRKGRKC